MVVINQDAPPLDLNGYDPVATAEPGDWFNPVRADFVVGFIENNLSHSKGRWAKKKFVLEAWQKDYIRTLFGWMRADGTRRYRRSFLFTGRKQGKTQLAAAIANACLFTDGENGAEVYCTAYDRDQAAYVFDAAASQVEACPALRRRSKILKSKKRILFRERGSVFVALPASDKGGHGASTHCVVYDEFHLYNTPRHVEVYESLHTSTANRDQPLEIITTTAGFDRTSLCYEEYEYAKRVRDGRVEDRAYLPMIFEAGPHDDWTSPETWRKACPNLGVTVTEEFLREKCEEAKRNPRKENTFRRLYLNQWTSQETRWISMRDYDECWGSAGELTGPRYGGLDMSAVEDLTAFVQVQRRPSGGFRAKGHYWTPHAKLEGMRHQGLPVDRWVREGWLTPIPGAVIDDSYISRRVVSEHARGGLDAVGFDPAHARQIRLSLERSGLTMLEVRQGAFTLGEPCKLLEKSIKAGTFDNSGDPVLAWCLENVEVKTDDNGNIRPVKPAHGSQKKIDAVSALVTGLAVLIAQPEPKRLTAANYQSLLV